MAADNEEEATLEEQLELQLREHNESLRDLSEALSSDPSNLELISVQEELIQSVKEVEEGLLHLKQARLLREVDTSIQCSKNGSEDLVVESLNTKDAEALSHVDQHDLFEAEPLVDQEYSIGSKCRFRFTDGQWYNGLIVQLEGSHSALVTFLNPTSESMLMCKFFLQKRCWFGSSCRLSHGIDVPISSLKKFVPTVWGPSMVGHSIWALEEGKNGLWREAELESWDENLKLGHVIFRDTGISSKLGTESISLSEHAELSDEDEETSSDYSTSSDYDQEDVDSAALPQGLGFLESTNLQSGIQTEVTLFAKWENHTRGVASKMMANMGYQEGMGLGSAGQGILDPISVRVLPSKQSLDHAFEAQRNEQGNGPKEGKKRSRGGKRKREKKYAEAARAAKEEGLKSDMFALINSQLSAHAEILKGTKKHMTNNNNNNNNNSNSNSKEKVGEEAKKEGGRRGLLAYEDEIKELKIRVEKLEEMANRNQREKVVYDAVMRKLNETRRALGDAEAAHTCASTQVLTKEKEKRWLKF